MAVNNEINIQLKAQDKASGVFKGLEGNTKKLESKFSKLWWVMKTVWKGFAVVWTATAVAGVKMFNLADDIETTIWKAQTVFWEYFNDMDKFASETGKAMWLSRSEFLKTAAGIQDLLVPMWFTREEATGMTQDMIWLSGALSEWSAWQYDAAQVGDILAKAMLWEREQLKSLGISISEADVQQRLLVNGTKDLIGVELQQAKALATQQLIFEKSTDAQKSFADGTDSLTRKKAELTATLKNAQETIAVALIPAFHELVNTLQPVIESAAKSIEMWAWNEENIKSLSWTMIAAIEVFKTIWQIITFVTWLLYKIWEAFGYITSDIFLNISHLLWGFKSLDWVIENLVIWWVELFSEFKESVVSWFSLIEDSATEKFWSIVNTIQWALQKAKDAAREIATLWFANTQTFNWGWTSWTKANGWPVKGWSAYLVGERWPEMFVPSWNWSIVPSGGFSGNVSINMGGVTVRNEADENRLATKIQNNLIEVLQQNKFWVS